MGGKKDRKKYELEQQLRYRSVVSHTLRKLKELMECIYIKGAPTPSYTELYQLVGLALQKDQFLNTHNCVFCPDELVFEEAFQQYKKIRSERIFEVLKSTYMLLRTGIVNKAVLSNGSHVGIEDVLLRNDEVHEHILLENGYARIERVILSTGERVNYYDVMPVSGNRIQYFKRHMHKFLPVSRKLCNKRVAVPCYTCAKLMKHEDASENLRLLIEEPAAAPKIILARKYKALAEKCRSNLEFDLSAAYNLTALELEASVTCIKIDRELSYAHTLGITHRPTSWF